MIRNGRNESSSGSRDNRTGINEKVVEKRRDSMITLNFGILTVRVGICSLCRYQQFWKRDGQNHSFSIVHRVLQWKLLLEIWAKTTIEVIVNSTFGYAVDPAMKLWSSNTFSHERVVNGKFVGIVAQKGFELPLSPEFNFKFKSPRSGELLERTVKHRQTPARLFCYSGAPIWITR